MLFVLCGIPSSGKSTWAKKLATAIPLTVISTDDIREKYFGVEYSSTVNPRVFGMARSMLTRSLEKGCIVCFDATNIRPSDRKPWVKIAKALDVPVVAVWFDCGLEQALSLQQNRERIVPDDVLSRMARTFVAPTHDEGFDSVWKVEPQIEPRA